MRKRQLTPRHRGRGVPKACTADGPAVGVDVRTDSESVWGNKMSIKDAQDKIVDYLVKHHYRNFRVAIGGGIMVDVGRPIPKEDFVRIAEIAKGYDLAIAGGIVGEG